MPIGAELRMLVDDSQHQALQ